MSVAGVCGLVALAAFLVLAYLLWRLARDDRRSYDREQRRIARRQLRARDPIDPENINV